MMWNCGEKTVWLLLKSNSHGLIKLLRVIGTATIEGRIIPTLLWMAGSLPQNPSYCGFTYVFGNNLFCLKKFMGFLKKLKKGRCSEM